MHQFCHQSLAIELNDFDQQNILNLYQSSPCKYKMNTPPDSKLYFPCRYATLLDFTEDGPEQIPANEIHTTNTSTHTNNQSELSTHTNSQSELLDLTGSYLYLLIKGFE